MEEEGLMASRAAESGSAKPRLERERRCFECSGELFGPICPACNPEIDLTGERLAAAEARAEKAERELAEVKEAEPDGPGAFEGDIFFGDARNSTRGTHCWRGDRWERLPSDAEVLMDLLASARSRAETAERLLATAREPSEEIIEAGLKAWFEPDGPFFPALGSQQREYMAAAYRAMVAVALAKFRRPA